MIDQDKIDLALEMLDNNISDFCEPESGGFSGDFIPDFHSIEDYEEKFAGYSESNWNNAKHLLIKDFEDKFNDYNNWIWEDDFNNEEDYEKALIEFRDEVVKQFKKERL